MTRRAFHVLMVLAAVTLTPSASAQQTENHELHAVPPPGAVVIDGKLDDWDLSGRIESFTEYRTRGAYSAEVAAMHDKDFFYLAVVWHDPTPMVNMIDPETDGCGWKSDCLQLRLITDLTLHIDCWFSTAAKRPMVKILYGTLNPGAQNISNFAPFPKPNATDAGAKEAFAPGDDAKSYTQEIALPWKLITGQGATVKETGKPHAGPKTYQPGDAFTLGMEFIWGSADGRSTLRRHADLIKEGAVSRGPSYFWADDNCWGTVKLEPKGRLNLPAPDYAKSEEVTAQKTSGPVKLSYTMPFDGFATLVIEDDEGRRVRNLIAAAPRSKGEQTDYWDYKGEDGKLVGTGKYRWHGLFRKSIDPAYEFTFGNPGNPPYEIADGTGGWLSDTSPPRAVAAAKELIVLGAERAEAGWSVIATDLDGRKKWGDRSLAGVKFLAVDDSSVYVLTRANDTPPAIARLDLKTGKPVPFAAGAQKVQLFQQGENPLVIQGYVIGGIAVSGNRLAVSLLDTGSTKQSNKKPAGKEAKDLDGLDVPAEAEDQLAPEDMGEALGAGSDAVRFYDKETGSIVGQLALPKPGCLAYDAAGTLYVWSNNQLMKTSDGKTLAAVIKEKMSPPMSITLDSAGQLFLGDRGTQQVKVYDKAGTFVRAIGSAGGRLAGNKWHADGMLNPAGIAVDGQRRLWVAEEDQCPKRVSVWGAGGKLVREFIGPAPRGGADVTADPDDKTRVFASGAEFKLDYRTGLATVVAGGLGDVSGQLMKAQGREYFMSKTGRLSLRKGNAAKPVSHMAWFLWKDGPAFMEEYPFLARGQFWERAPAGADGKQLATGPWLQPAQAGKPGIADGHGGSFSTSFLWMDLNDDGKPQIARENKTYLPITWTEPEDGGKPQANEILAGSRCAISERWRYPLGVPLSFGGYWLDDGFNLYSCGVEAGYHYTGGMGPVVARIPFKEWTPGGAPVWDVKDQQLLTGQMRISSAYGHMGGFCQWKAYEVHLPNGQSLFSNGQCNWYRGERLYLPAEGKVVVGPPITCIRDDGTILWTYKDDWSGPLRAYYDKSLAKADRDDLLVGTVGCLGRAKTELGTVFAIQSSVGRVYFMTVDGLLIGSAFRDYRLGEPWPSDMQRGMALGGTTLGGDWAGGHFFKSEKSNEFYLIAGGSQMAYHVIKLNGLESVSALRGGEVTVTKKELHPDAPAIAKKAVAPNVEKMALALDLGKATAKNATVTPVEDAGGTLLKIAIKGKQQGGAGVEIPAAGGKWDLSKYRFVVAQVRNLGANALKVSIRLDNPNAADDGKGGVADGRDVDPRSGWTWTKVGIRRPADAVKVKLFGMAEYPWGRPYEKARSGAETETNDSWWFHAYPWGRPVDAANGSGIDPANVAKLVIAVADPKEDCTLEIRNICAAGAAPSAELLADPAKFFPCIDEFGQYIHADWPGKAREPEDLKKRRLDEARDLDANPGPPEWDQYGGWKNGPTLTATGYFRTEKHEGKWWLVDPEGKLFFSSGITCVNAGVFEDWVDIGETDETPVQDREPWFRGLAGLQAGFPEHAFKDYRSMKWTGHYGCGPVKSSFDFARANNHRKYGNTWDNDFARVSHRRMKSWGVNTLGIYSSPAVCFQKKTPYVMCVRLKLDLVNPRLDHGVFWDVFGAKDARSLPLLSADFLDSCRHALGSHYDDWRIGHIVDVEGRGDPALDTGENDVAYALGTLRQPHDAADPKPSAKTVFVADLKVKYAQIERLNDAWGTKYASWEALLSSRETPDVTKAHEDLAAFHAKAFDTYFRTIRPWTDMIVPGLYMGMLFEGAGPATIAAAAKHCDLLCFRLNRTSPADFKLPDGIDKPVLVEFGFSALDRGMLAGDLPDQAARAAAYRQYMLGALKNPQIVGCHWAQFRDYPASGRTRDEANYNAGFVDVADTPYAEMVQAAREIGKTMYKTRAEAK